MSEDALQDDDNIGMPHVICWICLNKWAKNGDENSRYKVQSKIPPTMGKGGFCSFRLLFLWYV